MYDNALLKDINEKNGLWLRDYKNKRYRRYKDAAIPKWKRMDYILPEIPEYKEFKNVTIDYDREDDRIIVEDINKALNKPIYSEYLKNSQSYGISEKFTSLSEVFHNTGVLIDIPRNKRVEPIYIRYDFDKENDIALEYNIIIANENSEVTVVLEYWGKEDKAFHNGVTKVFAHQNARVKVIKVQGLSDEGTHFDSNLVVAKRDAYVECVHMDIGSQIIVSDYSSYLEENGSELAIDSLYVGDGYKKIDLSYKANHIGKRTKSELITKGVLKDYARKVFRGTLDFKQGATRSKGSELESVLLLDDTVKSDAIPVLLCEEDDVEGEHAASAGQVDHQQLFYIMSRGFSEDEAKKLIVEASFRPIIEKIEDEGLHQRVENEIHKRIVGHD